jgi:hypothetical protein
VLGELPGETARVPLPACDSLRNQPCRPDPLPGASTGSGSGATGRGAASTVLRGTESARGPCRPPRPFVFRVRQNNGRVTRAAVYVDGRRVQVVRGRRVNRVRVRPRARANQTITIVASTVTHRRVVTVRRYRNCARTSSKTVVERPRRRRR